MRILEPCIKFCKFLPFYWLFWWATALWTDVTGAMKVVGLIDAKWAYADNYHFLVKSLHMYSIPSWLPAVFLILIIMSLAAVTAVFAMACYLQIKQRPQWETWTVYAFMLSLCLWMGFFIADQLIMNFDLEQNHMVQGGFEMLCFIFFVIVLQE